MVPTSTGATKSLGDVIPELKDKVEGISIRVPTPNVSLVEFVFSAKQNLSAEKINNSLSRDLVCIKMIDRGIPRKGYELFYNDTMIGKITSGTQSPTLNVGIGLGYVQKDFSKIGIELYMLVRGKKIKCKIVDSPFFREGSLKN